MNNNETGLALLRKPFPDHQISLRPVPTKKDNPKGDCKVCGGYHGLPAVHLEYVGHAALTDRLLDSDPKWTWEPLAIDEHGLPRFDKNGGLWIKLTVDGHTRLGYGNAEDSNFKEVGSREKEVIGDALRNAAMRFGAALELWHKGDLHGDSERKPIPASERPLPAQETPKSSPENKSVQSPGDYVAKVGRIKGKRLADCDPDEIQGALKWFNENNPRSRDWSEFADKAMEFFR